MRAWQAAGWDVVLWHSGQLAASPMVGVELRHVSDVIAGSVAENALHYERKHKNHAACADLFRYHVLSELGGSYCDIDVLPDSASAPAFFEKRVLPGFDRSWFSRKNRLSLPWSLEIRFIFTPTPKHPLLMTLRDTAVCNSERFITEGGYKKGLGSVLHRTGPLMARDVVMAYAAENRQRLNAFLLTRVLNDSTPENINEHFHAKFPEILRIANEN